MELFSRHVGARLCTARAFVLRSVDFGDTDRILTLLTEPFGKMSAIARGARVSKRRFVGLQSHTLVKVGLRLGSSELGTLTQVDEVRAFPRVLRDLTKLTCASAAFELVREMVAPHEPDARLFETAVELLERLDDTTGRDEELLLAFQVRVLALVGFAIGVEVCGRCRRGPGPEQAALFDPMSGSIICRACGGGPLYIGGPTRVRLRETRGREWSNATLHQSEVLSSGAMEQLRSAIADFTRHRLDRELVGNRILAQVTR